MKENSVPSIEPKTFAELQKDYGEINHRTRLFESIKQLKNSYEELLDKNAIAKIEKEIKL